jgi:hypothetical protein
VIRSVVRQALADAGAYAANRSRPFEPEEEDILRGLFVAGLPTLALGLKAELAPVGLQAQVAGVLCHKNPIVRQLEGPCRGEASELGDLLVTVRRAIDGSSGTNHALLLQLKAGGSATAPQLELYRSWPRFIYRYGERKVSEPVPHEGALVADVVLNQKSTRAMVLGAPTRPLDGILARLLSGTGGRSFAELNQLAACGLETDWDGIIWDLLFDSAERLYHGVGRGYETNSFVQASRTPRLLLDTPHGRLLAEHWDEIEGAGGAQRYTDAPELEDRSEGVSSIVIDIEPTD